MGSEELERAADRGRRIRTAILAELRRRQPRTFDELATVVPRDVHRSEVEFQLKRLAEDREAADDLDGAYWLIP